jgi:hypothetical protein
MPRQANPPSLNVASWASRTQTNGISRVPTHSVGRANERRAYIRARLSLPLRVHRVAGQRDSTSCSLHTRDISSSGVYFLYPQPLELGTPIDIEVLLVDRPFGRGSVRLCSTAHVVRAQESGKPGWHGLAALFDDISFVRDDHEPLF